MRLAKEGYGDIVTIKNLNVQTFIDLIDYEEYTNKYLKIFREINKNN